MCKTGTYYGQEEKKTDQVRVTVAEKLTATSKEEFTYVVSTSQRVRVGFSVVVAHYI